jgi:hypothetical protein
MRELLIELVQHVSYRLYHRMCFVRDRSVGLDTSQW